MYENFLSAYPADSDEAPRPFSAPKLAELDGFNELVSLGAGKSFGGGILRIHSESEMERAAGLIADGFPDYDGRVAPIAKDWLGRQYAIPLTESGFTPNLVLLIEPGSGEVFEVDCGLEELFDAEMLADPETFLASDLYAEWREVNSESVASGQCVGFKVPLFLGGDGSVDNLELSDESVYWSLMGQLRTRTA
ncbi:T6SS immunity protein Tdi1 domain-containing protein [Streptomyces sp. NPDC057011]|uniref:T6SS immunity protein Tdi1 domain-containing protein n=1 Tax=unclassified Streptomyces TaxID=2593676 RepID=UPI00362B5049